MTDRHTRAIENTGVFLRQLLNPKVTPKVPRNVRTAARQMLRDYPTPQMLLALIECAEALRYYRRECTGHEPSESVWQRKVDEALAKLEAL